jgi:hypothetical protein
LHPFRLEKLTQKAPAVGATTHRRSPSLSSFTNTEFRSKSTANRALKTPPSRLDPATTQSLVRKFVEKRQRKSFSLFAEIEGEQTPEERFTHIDRAAKGAELTCIL